jgi:hypothetical protein
MPIRAIPAALLRPHELHRLSSSTRRRPCTSSTSAPSLRRSGCQRATGEEEIVRGELNGKEKAAVGPTCTGGAFGSRVAPPGHRGGGRGRNEETQGGDVEENRAAARRCKAGVSEEDGVVTGSWARRRHWQRRLGTNPGSSSIHRTGAQARRRCHPRLGRGPASSRTGDWEQRDSEMSRRERWEQRDVVHLCGAVGGE